MSHQDWNIISISNSQKQKQNLPKDIIERKGDTSLQNELKKVENETENFSIKIIPNQLSKDIMNARCKLKLSQKDMAIKLNIQQNVYTELENGKAIYNTQTKQLISKIEKIVGIRFENKK
jgi:ribosome-binding protein aMBF1 (putative translation factor)